MTNALKRIVRCCDGAPWFSRSVARLAAGSTKVFGPSKRIEADRELVQGVAHHIEPHLPRHQRLRAVHRGRSSSASVRLSGECEGGESMIRLTHSICTAAMGDS